MSNKTAVIYARVSTNLQDVENSIQAQVQACQNYAKKEGLEVLNIYSDKAESGRNSARPEFQRMISDARQKKFHIILVHKLDRFARNREDAVTFKALLRKHGIELFSVTEQLGDDIYSRLIEGILEVINEFYSLNLGEEVKKGKRQALSRGFHPGGNVPFGYKLEKVMDGDEEHSRLIPDPETAPIIQKAFEIAAEGRQIVEVMEFINSATSKTKFNKDLWHYSTVKKLLRRRAYIGEAKSGTVIRKNNHPPLISPEVFEIVQAKKKANIGKKNTNSFYLLSSGIAKCSACGANLCGARHKRKLKSGTKIYRGYICQGHTNYKNCSGKELNADKLEEKVKEVFLEEIGRYGVKNKNKKTKDLKKQQEKKIKSLEKEIKNIDKQKKNIIKAIAAGIPVEEVKEELQNLSIEKEVKEKNLKIEKENLKNIRPVKSSSAITQLAKIIPELPPEKLKEVLKSAIKLEVNITTKECALKVLLNPGHDSITHTFFL